MIWGGGHNVDLVNLLKNIRINTLTEDNITYDRLSSDQFADAQFQNNGAITKDVNDKNVTCDIPIYKFTMYNGGRKTNARRPHRRRATRTTRTRRTRRV